jgi:hypothetical protein
VLSAILPPRIDNTFRGRAPALWLLVPVVIMKTGIALGTIFNGRTAAQSADGIPLDTFTNGGAETVLALFAAWGLAQLVIGAFGVLTLVRYRALVPFMFIVLLAEHLARRWIFLVHPIPRTGTPPGALINLGLLALMVVGLVLSLWRRPE